MTKRVRIINDLSDLVPLLQIFTADNHKRVFDFLASGWYTEDQLKESLESEDLKESLEILRESGMLESKWRIPDAGEKPDIEYTTSYTRVRINLQCSMEDLGNIISISFMGEKNFNDIIEELTSCIKSGKDSISNISISEDISPILLKAIVKRSSKLLIKGQKLEIISGEF